MDNVTAFQVLSQRVKLRAAVTTAFSVKVTRKDSNA